jgi:hypothetical protein
LWNMIKWGKVKEIVTRMVTIINKKKQWRKKGQ